MPSEPSESYESDTVGFVYTENFDQYNFGEHHPLTPKRIEVTYALMKAYHLLDHPRVHILPPRMATQEEILRVHTQDYLDTLQKLSGEGISPYKAVPEYGLGPGDNPIFTGMYNAAMAVCGASLTTADYILDGHSRAFNITGGLHHAMPSRASGFCIFNDIAVAIEHILHKKPGTKILYLDYDAHHGDGVQWIFYDRPEVLTLSFHQYGALFPGTGSLKENGEGAGEGYALNVPLLPGLIDTLFMEAFEHIVPKVMAAYEPDIVVLQNGVDMHFTDPLTNMGLSTEGFENIFKKINQYVSKYSSQNKMLAIGGGGYNIGVVGRAWTMMLAELMGVPISEPLPLEWITLLEETSDEPIPSLLRDRNFLIEEKQLKDPFWLDSLEDNVAQAIKTFDEILIPKIKSDISHLLSKQKSV